jgi:hypothetical protein
VEVVELDDVLGNARDRVVPSRAAPGAERPKLACRRCGFSGFPPIIDAVTRECASRVACTRRQERPKRRIRPLPQKEGAT